METYTITIDEYERDVIAAGLVKFSDHFNKEAAETGAGVFKDVANRADELLLKIQYMKPDKEWYEDEA